ncbi:acyl-CoA thioesterase-1 [Dokdonella fugitiva]|uniref:Acyl-CoA thioesterase-1 n=1 Tax=Dokdonella fugitiva TaxID=328517 RepID=A0A839F421_9GAMM|nr:arylesterase [Dokdonella fugitiva]MBA8888288.1 acyl-CoA thioesterase-1 [Dokdonella fugitiva]
MLRILFVLLSSFAASIAVAAPRPVLVLGDSLSAAYGLSPKEGWVTLLDERLAAARPIRNVVNASISGETSAGGLARLPALLKEHAPALVVVELGANDGLRGLPLAQLRANLVKILEAVRGAGAHAVLVGIELPVNYGPQYRDGLREVYRGLAGEFNVPLVPFLLDGVALDPALMQDDGLHPRAVAEPRVLENVWKVLEPALKALPAG